MHSRHSQHNTTMKCARMSECHPECERHLTRVFDFPTRLECRHTNIWYPSSVDSFHTHFIPSLRIIEYNLPINLCFLCTFSKALIGKVVFNHDTALVLHSTPSPHHSRIFCCMRKVVLYAQTECQAMDAEMHLVRLSRVSSMLRSMVRLKELATNCTASRSKMKPRMIPFHCTSLSVAMITEATMSHHAFAGH